MRRIGWAALAVGFVLGAGSSEAGAATVFTYEASASGIDDLGLFGSPGATLNDQHFYLVETLAGTDQTTGLAEYSTVSYRTDGTLLSDYGSGGYVPYTVIGQPDPNCHRADCMGGVGIPHTVYFFQTFTTVTSQNYGTVFIFGTPQDGPGDPPSTLDEATNSFTFTLPSQGTNYVSLEDLRLSATLLPDDPAISPVPIPASLPMFAGALLALGALAYRKRLRDAL